MSAKIELTPHQLSQLQQMVRDGYGSSISHLVQLALDHYLQAHAKHEKVVNTALSMEGALSETRPLATVLPMRKKA